MHQERTIKLQSGAWQVICLPDDGARLSHLRRGDTELLTAPLRAFSLPQADYGIYETRPVYGYDDCFPTVDSCSFPDRDFVAPDHGELWQVPWQVEAGKDFLDCKVASKLLPVTFHRRMEFSRDAVDWKFTIDNHGKQALPLMHVMHPLMPPGQIKGIVLPEFGSWYDEMAEHEICCHDPYTVTEFLLTSPEREAHMLILRELRGGTVRLSLTAGFDLEIIFPHDLFPSLGIWWNNHGYPNESGCRRRECAFEPIPGPDSKLTDAWDTNTCLMVKPEASFNWTVTWKVHE